MSDGNGSRILLVDDETDALLFLYDFLTALGYPVEGASRPVDALKSIRRRPPAALISDVRMPGIDGLELSQKCRSCSPGTRVILLSAFVDEDLERRARRAGAEALLSKPAPVAALLRLLGRLLGPAAMPGST